MGQGYASSVPRNQLEGIASDFIGVGRDWLNSKVYHKSGTGLGDLMLGDATDYLDELSWGKPLINKGAGPLLDSRLPDVLGLGGLFGAPAKKLAKEGLKEFATPRPGFYNQKGYIIPADVTGVDKDAYIKATVMKNEGSTIDDIYKDTHLYMDDPVGTPYKEVAHGDEMYIPESKAGVNPDMMYGSRVKNSVLEDLYPDDSEYVELTNEGLPSNISGRYTSGDVDKIQVKGQPPSNFKTEKATMEHESQHLFDNLGGGTKGSSVNQMNDLIKYRLGKKKHRNNKFLDSNSGTLGERDAIIRDNQGVRTLQEMMRKGESNIGQHAYRSVAGEQRANLVPTRAHMSQQEMWDDPFYKQFKLPDAEHIQMHPNMNFPISEKPLLDLIDRYISRVTPRVEKPPLPKEMRGHEPYMNPKYAR